MKTTGEIIKELRESRGLTQGQLAKIIGASNYTTITKWEKGENFPRGRDIKVLCEYFKVSSDYILGLDTEYRFNQSSEYDYLPISVAAGLPEHVRGLSEDDIDTITIPDAVMGKWAGCSDIYMMRVNGESMNKIIPDQSLIAVKEVNLSELKDGDIVVYSNGHDYSVKHFYRDENEVRFRPDSTDTRFREYTFPDDSNDLKIHGKVVVYIVEMD
ncbi:LexA family transcriptional regulator [Virgibacillus sp. Bac332]|uniref:LexA family protein n=1 Tax=Virgibacillus sp. Bac332 TaxID=2419842 RepID=UPI000EF5164F|nr:XRE family transcriptional regulator [Virgibacillus sp. Bac332]